MIEPTESDTPTNSTSGFKALFTGSQKLWVSFWLFFFVPGMALNFIFIYALLPQVKNNQSLAILTTVFILVVAAYKIMAWYSVLVCSNNTEVKALTYAARIIVILDMVNGVFKAPLFFLLSISAAMGKAVF